MDRKSEEQWSRYQDAVAQGCCTNSKHPRTHIYGVAPIFAEACKGSMIFTHNDHGVGNRYIDFICGLGTNLVGYGNNYVRAAMNNANGWGACPSLPTKWELECGERMKELFPFVERWKFLNTGSEACTAACIMARAVTGRKYIISAGYHGWHPEFTSLTPPAYGVNQHSHILKCDLFGGSPCEQTLDNVAAVIIEPDMFSQAQLADLRDRCTEAGTMLIFDEIITGYRYLHYSVAQDSQVRPDLILLGKAMANGEPITAVGGSKDILDTPYFVSSTYAGNTRRFAAAIAVMDILLKHSGYENEYLWRTGGNFKDEFNQISTNIQIDGYNVFGRFKADPEYMALFQQETVKAGLLFGPSWFWNWGHIGYKDEVLHSCKEIIHRIERKEVCLQGLAPEKPLSLLARQK